MWMFLEGRQDNGGVSPQSSGGSAPVFNIFVTIIPTPRQTSSVSVTLFVTTVSTSTYSVTSHQTESITASSIDTATVSIPNIPSASLASQESLLKSTASLTQTNTILASVFGGFIILLIIALGIFLFAWTRRRHRLRRLHDFRSTYNIPLDQPNSDLPVDSIPPPPTQEPATPIELNPRRAGSATDALFSHPPNVARHHFSRPFSSPGLVAPESQGFPLPTISIHPNTPSISGRDGNAPTSPLPRPETSHSSLYHEALNQQAAEERSRADIANADRLGLPVIVRAGHRESMSSIGSEEASEHRRNETLEQPTARTSTRASSGVFPDP